jgi:hypothetical protein
MRVPLGIVVEDLLRESAKPIERMVMTRKQATQRLIPRTLDIQPSRIAQHHHEERNAHPLRSNLGPGTARIDLCLAPGGRFKAHGGVRESISLGAQRTYRQSVKGPFYGGV